MNQPYRRQVGDFEIRILPDGRLVFVAPDQELAEIVNSLESGNIIESINKENQYNDESE